MKYVLGQNIYREKMHSFRLKLEMFKDHFWMFVGILKADIVPPNNKSLGESGQVWKEGSSTIDNALKNVTKQGDTVVMLPSCHYIWPLVNNFTSKYPSHKPGN
jgi:hypothetical protein